MSLRTATRPEFGVLDDVFAGMMESSFRQISGVPEGAIDEYLETFFGDLRVGPADASHGSRQCGAAQCRPTPDR
ncbi:hypothetical protein [Frankia sp. QA3]|uniref:hypothetical protein n=1 Tax=Frankia sp. QA3 TaxID=710111 RepID=UPI0018DEDA4F|nr:hypothetical protein [Frankia sp. QA3]